MLGGERKTVEKDWLGWRMEKKILANDFAGGKAEAIGIGAAYSYLLWAAIK